jgi:hypothetical protein
MGSLRFFIDFIRPAALGPGVLGISPGSKGGRCVGLTILPPSRAWTSWSPKFLLSPAMGWLSFRVTWYILFSDFNQIWNVFTNLLSPSFKFYENFFYRLSRFCVLTEGQAHRQTIMTHSWLCTPLYFSSSLTLNAKYSGRAGDSPHAMLSVVAYFSHVATFLSSALYHVTWRELAEKLAFPRHRTLL